MMEFDYDLFFAICRVMIYVGVIFCVYARVTKRRNKKEMKNDVINDNANRGENIIVNNREKENKRAEIFMRVGMISIIVGIILFILGAVTVIAGIYIFLGFIKWICQLD